MHILCIPLNKNPKQGSHSPFNGETSRNSETIHGISNSTESRPHDSSTRSLISYSERPQSRRLIPVLIHKTTAHKDHLHWEWNLICGISVYSLRTLTVSHKRLQQSNDLRIYPDLGYSIGSGFQISRVVWVSVFNLDLDKELKHFPLVIWQTGWRGIPSLPRFQPNVPGSRLPLDSQNIISFMVRISYHSVHTLVKISTFDIQ